MTPHGMVHWTELHTHDAGKAKSFYGHTLGWTFDAMPMPDGTQYYLCMSGDEMAGGMFTPDDPQFQDVPDHWITYFAVDDVDARLDKAKEAGATILREPFDVPGIGRIAILQAPGGAAMGWMTPTEAA